MLTVTVDTKEIERKLSEAPGQIRYATQMGLNKTAYDIRDGVKKEMTQTFDRPTPYTLNSLKVDTAKPSNLAAEVNFKGKPSGHYLKPQVFGGGRPLKIFERNYDKTNPGGNYLIPGTKKGQGPPLDRYGNVSGAQILRMLSVLGQAREGQNETTKSRQRKIRQLKPIKNFVVINGNIYERIQRNLKLWFFKPKNAPAYKPTLQYDKVSKRISDERLQINMHKGLMMAFKRAGLT